MNIIELFEKLKIDKGSILLLSTEEIRRVEKQVNVEKRLNPEIASNTSENLILALKEYKEELLFVLSNRILFNFFTHNNFSRNHFSNYDLAVSDEKIKHFIAFFLADDLISFFSLKLSKGWFHYLEELDFLLDLKRYFPEEVIYKMRSLVFSKLDFAISQLTVLERKEFSNIAYIKHRTFYNLLSHFTTVESDQKISNLLSLVIKFYIKKTNTVFFTSVIQSMAFYRAINENINEVLAKNGAAVYKPELKQDKKTHPAFSIFIGLICAIIPFLVSRCS
ncbi:hypothetical protein IRZ71_24555 [Flavobacterium sp. ANB]|uniref:hypothetical protein n=1 Tax=unclassified Flavobacterium TaxID=196869 RepID=UPI0012B6F22F|nr:MULTISPECIES: hypothetical protein [unclassified Flavobacterium]MBF4519523.1 hypothetical protein [Flavobacterium sp. ANB]MTD72393.1 hypothetical protein [Flavobacterium sp. LC2016-13]